MPKESGNINPQTVWDKFKSAPRPLLKYVCVPLLVYVIAGPVSDTKTELFLWLVFGLFVARGGEKMVDMWTARK